MKNLFRKLQRNEEGQALAEYNLLATGLFLVVITVMSVTGESIRNPFCVIADLMNYPACAELQPDWGLPEVEETEEPDQCVNLNPAGESQCVQSDECDVLPGVNSGSWFSGGEDIEVLVIKGGPEYHIFQSGITFDGCYYVNLDGPNVTWEKQAGGHDCKNINHLQSWFIPQCEG